jgi:magnesium transporter
MISRYEYHGGVWVDLERPSVEEVQQILREFGISERLGTELLSPTPSPLVAGDTGAALLVLHFPIPRTDEGESKSQEIDFIVGPQFIVTVRYELVIPLHHLKKVLESDLAITGNTSVSTDVLLEILFAHLYTSVRDHIAHAADRLARIEQHMFTLHAKDTVRVISIVGRDFLHLDATLVNHEEPLARFFKALTDRKFFGPAFAERAARIAAERVHIAHLIHTYRAVATELRETNMALVETRQNEIMKILTIITVMILPLELIAVIFGMHAGGTPFEGHPQAFLIILAIMLTLVGSMALYFSRKHWL